MDRLKTLKDEWDRRLEDEGLGEIEDGDGTPTKDKARRMLQRNPVLAERRADYFTAAEHALVEHVFDSPTDRAVWTAHARGDTEREIAEQVGVARATVGRRIREYRRRFGLVWPG